MARWMLGAVSACFSCCFEAYQRHLMVRANVSSEGEELTLNLVEFEEPKR